MNVLYKRKQWQHMITRNFSLFHACMHVVGSQTDSRKFGMPAKEEACLMKNGTTTYIFFASDDLSKYYRAIEQACISPVRLKRMELAYKKHCASLLEASTALKKNPSRKNFRHFCKKYQIMCAGLSLTTLLGRYAHNILLNKLKEKFPGKSNQELEIITGEITYPNGHTPLLQSQLSLLAMGAELQKNNRTADTLSGTTATARMLQKHMRRYSMIPVNYNEDPWTEKEIIGQVAEVMKGPCAEELQALKQNHRQKISLCKKNLVAIRSRDITTLARAIQKATLINEYRKYVFCNASLAYRPLFAKAAAKLGFDSWKQCWKMTPDELELVCFSDHSFSGSTANRRNRVLVVYDNISKTYAFASQKTADRFFVALNKKTRQQRSDSVNRQITGTVANPGKIIGTAKIIVSSHDFYKFKTGDVIVAPMTSVDFVPLMKRAAAFVTDEGGITSHASIVSREMNKPCVIGTKIATKVFKDGDRVEVDAHNGTIKKL